MNAHRAGLKDFFDYHKDDDLIFSTAKVVTKNMLQPTDIEDAISIMIQHSPSISSIMNRKLITKVLIFQYLNARHVSVTADFSKPILLERLFEFWNHKFSDQSSQKSECTDQSVHQAAKEDQFPIHQMSRQFSTWFFKMCNESQLKIVDFWADAEYSIEMIASGQLVRQEQGSGSQSLLELMQSLHSQDNLLFNPNDCHDGIQGRINVHGLVMVLCCGTLHSPGVFIGVFECMFGLLRDPYADGNWKIKHLRMRLNSSSPREAPRLEECSYLETMMALPPPTNMDL
ncbi:uncharacterized protein C3orf38 homolog isoform X1 [Bradysia coprophila]|uniref:uncharacterized protein C3orf38 homolog isoform X1 n=1 Tax=Bradysia coprophila TaxID=38358 RepID=UPI00187DCD9E|nr:uncharacterized protein C3orf38 homolog isoform X1 [Bradysia coprophila]